MNGVNPERDVFDEWLLSIDNGNTRNNHGSYFQKLLEITQFNVEEMRNRLKTNPSEVWREAKAKGVNPPSHRKAERSPYALYQIRETASIAGHVDQIARYTSAGESK